MLYFFTTEKSGCFFCLFFFFQNKTKQRMWSRDYKQEWSSSSNNKEGVGCSFVHLIYWLIRRIIKRLPSCQGRRLMAVDSGCQGVDLLWGQVWDVGILWRQKVLASGLSLWHLLWAFLWFLCMHSPWNSLLFSVLAWVSSVADPETMIWVHVVSKDIQWESETRKKRQKVALWSRYHCGQLEPIPLGTLITL